VAELIARPSVVPAVGTRPKRIEEFVGRVNTPAEARRTGAALSIARMQSPSGWVEPGQVPDFDEFTVVLRGALRVESRRPDGSIDTLDVLAGQAVIARRGEWVRYSTPGERGAEYVAVCLPAFSPETVHRDL
jgi:mannose-6-phosphate isomerase-like protein (cupin superfamily)